MAVSTDNAFSGPFLTNGATTQFPFGFTAPGAAEVAVVTYDAAGQRADVAAADYAVVLNGGTGFATGGSVQFATAPVAGLRLYVLLAPAFTQDIAFENGSGWLAEPVNEAHDRGALRDQALARDLARAPKGQPGAMVPDIGAIADGQALALVDGLIQGVANDPASAENAAARSTRFAGLSDTARQRAETARTEALDAAAIAQGAAAGSLAQGIYPSLAEGIASVGVGASFYVPDGNGDNVLWRNEGGTAVRGGHVAPGVESLRAQIASFASRRFIGRQDVPAAGDADVPAITTLYAAARPRPGVIIGLEYRGGTSGGAIAPLVAAENPADGQQLIQLRRAAPCPALAGAHETVLFAAIGQPPLRYAAGDYLGFACQAGSIRCTGNTLEDSGPDNGGRWQAAGDTTSLSREHYINDDSRLEIRLLVDEGDGIEAVTAREADATAFLRDGHNGFLPIFLGHGGFRGQSAPARNQASPRQLEQFWRIPVANFSRHGIQTPELEGPEFAGRAIGAAIAALTAGKRVILYIQEIHHQLDQNAGLSAEGALASLQQLCAVLRQGVIAGAGASAAQGLVIGVLNLPQPHGAGSYTPARGHAVNMLLDAALANGTAEFDFIVNLAALPELTLAPPPEGNIWYMADRLHRTTAGERLVAERIRQDTAQWLETAVTARMAALVHRAEGTAAEVDIARDTAMAAIGLETAEQIAAVEDAAVTSITTARNWADSEGMEPGGPGTLSAKEWATQTIAAVADFRTDFEDVPATLSRVRVIGSAASEDDSWEGIPFRPTHILEDSIGNPVAIVGEHGELLVRHVSQPVHYIASEDEPDRIVSGWSMLDGMPIQLRSDGRTELVLGPKTMSAIISAVDLPEIVDFGLSAISLWRGPASASDVRVGKTLMRAQLSENVNTMPIATPNWRGPVAMPRVGSSLIALAVATGHLQLIQYIGQSNSTTSGTSVTIWNGNTARFPRHVFRFAAAGSYTGGGSENVAANYGDLTGAVDGPSAGGMWPHTTAAYLAQYRSRFLGYEESPMIVRADGEGGIPLTFLLKGDTPVAGKFYYENAIETRKAAKTKADDYGLNLDCHVVFIQGEDQSVPTDQYQTYFSELIKDHLADTITATGRPLASFIVVQPNGMANGSNAHAGGALAQLAELRERRGSQVVLSGPMYDCPLDVDHIHASSVGRLIHTDRCNYVRRQVIAHGSFAPLDLVRRAKPAIAANQRLRGAGLAADTMITASGTGTGGLGTYTLSNANTLSSRVFSTFGAIFEGSIADTTLTVTKIRAGSLDIAVNGTQVTARFNRPVLVDHDWTPTVGAGLGFSWADASGAADILMADISHDLITLTLSRPGNGAARLGYAVTNCASEFRQAGGADGTNWAAARGLIYADTSEVSTAWQLDPSFGPRTIRLPLVRFEEYF